MKKHLLLAFLIFLPLMANAQVTYQCKTSAVVIKNNGDINKVRLVLPVPSSSNYQDINNLNLSKDEIFGIDNSDNLYAKKEGKMSGDNFELTETYTATLFPMYIDMSQFTTLYPYDTNSEIYQRYTVDKVPYIDTSNAKIQEISSRLWSEAKENIIDYARLCYEHVGTNYSYQNPNTGIHTIEEIMNAGGGDCGNLASIFVNLLRAKKIPARHIVTVRPDGSFHVWADFYLQNYGWIPVDVNMKLDDPNGNYFGYCRGDGIIMSDDICHNLDLGEKKPFYVVLLQTYYWWYWGSGSVSDSYSTKGTIVNDWVSPKLKSVEVSSSGVELDWTSFAGATSYKIEVFNNSTDEKELEQVVSGSSTRTVLKKLSPYTNYRANFIPIRKIGNIETTMGTTYFSFVTKDLSDVELDETEPITIGKSGKASYCGDKSLDFSYSEEVKAYIATGFDKDEGTIWLTRVKDVPAGVPVLIKGEANKTYDVPVTDSENSYYRNMFKGNRSGATVQITETDGDLVNYYLSGDGTFKSVNKSANIGNNKCYLQLPSMFKPAETGATQKVTIKDIGKASYAAPVDLDFTNVEGLKAFTATGYDKSSKTIWLTRVMKVQKGEGLLLKGDAKDYEIPSAAVQSSYMNMFVGNTSGASVQVQEKSEDGSQTNYYLKGDGSFVSVNGFVNIGNNKCYLELPTDMVAGAASTRGAEANYIMEESEVIKLPISFRSIDNDGNGTTAIRETKQSRDDDAYYTLQGQRVENPGKGLYIKNGKKVIIR
jgi:hypothetical protein